MGIPEAEGIAAINFKRATLRHPCPTVHLFHHIRAVSTSLTPLLCRARINLRSWQRSVCPPSEADQVSRR